MHYSKLDLETLFNFWIRSYDDIKVYFVSKIGILGIFFERFVFIIYITQLNIDVSDP